MSLTADTEMLVLRTVRKTMREAAPTGGHWITISGSAGTTHLYISDGGNAGPKGTVLAGPSSLLHTNIAHLPPRHEVTHHPSSAPAPKGASAQPRYAEVEGAPKPAPRIRAEMGWALHNKTLGMPAAKEFAKAGWVSTPEGDTASHNAEFRRNNARYGGGSASPPDPKAGIAAFVAQSAAERQAYTAALQGKGPYPAGLAPSGKDAPGTYSQAAAQRAARQSAPRPDPKAGIAAFVAQSAAEKQAYTAALQGKGPYPAGLAPSGKSAPGTYSQATALRDQAGPYTPPSMPAPPAPPPPDAKAAAKAAKAEAAMHKANRLSDFDVDQTLRNLHQAEAPGGLPADVARRAGKLADHFAAEEYHYRTHPKLKFAATRQAAAGRSAASYRAKAQGAGHHG